MRDHQISPFLRFKTPITPGSHSEAVRRNDQQAEPIVATDPGVWPGCFFYAVGALMAVVENPCEMVTFPAQHSAGPVVRVFMCLHGIRPFKSVLANAENISCYKCVTSEALEQLRSATKISRLGNIKLWPWRIQRDKNTSHN